MVGNVCVCLIYDDDVQRNVTFIMQCFNQSHVSSIKYVSRLGTYHVILVCEDRGCVFGIVHIRS